MEGGAVEADTIVLAAGITPSAAAAVIPVERDRRGRIVTNAAMRSVSHPHVWAIGDCAAIPGPEGQPYPALAQHAIREARAVARNVHAVAQGRAPAPFVYRALGTMAAFGHTRAAADVRGLRLSGFPAWWMRRTYYLFQMPRWDTRLRIALDWTVALCFGRTSQRSTSRTSTSRSDATVRRESWQRPGLQAPRTRPHPTLPPLSRAVSHRLSLRHRALEHRRPNQALQPTPTDSRCSPFGAAERGREAAAARRRSQGRDFPAQEKGHHFVYTGVDVRSLRSSWPAALMRDGL